LRGIAAASFLSERYITLIEFLSRSGLARFLMKCEATRPRAQRADSFSFNFYSLWKNCASNASKFAG